VDSRSVLALIEIHFDGGDSETQLLPLTVVDAAAPAAENGIALATIECPDGSAGLLRSGEYPPKTANLLLSLISATGRLPGVKGELCGAGLGPYADAMIHEGVCLMTGPPEQQERNVAVRFGELFILKMLRRPEPGPNPDVDVPRFLFEEAGFMHAAPAAGCLEYKLAGKESMIVGVMHAFVGHQRSFWQRTVDHLGRFFERVLAHRTDPPAGLPAHPLDLGEAEPGPAGDLIRTYLDDVRLLGKRTGELHQALASSPENPEFAPQRFDSFYLNGEYHGLTGLARESLRLLRMRMRDLPSRAQADARAVLEMEPALLESFRALRDLRAPGLRIRIHGDFHLKQVLDTGGDLIFIDFEGDVSRPLNERRVKRSPLRDVAGMLRSLNYAAIGAIFDKAPGLTVRHANRAYVTAWAQFWYLCVGAAFLDCYRRQLQDSPILPGDDDELRTMLDVYLLSKAAYDLGYELSNRPDWAPVALSGLRELAALRLMNPRTI
jgi:maltose alpha-D-glucosyltransferase/alpha-amylase